ncbi:hypothetical protein L6452_12983 [Arctium lappa]|uniref:Uncharacterized protein n=1 Tax=Arctium lappa TaxID=4217 RepID=A0ACB9CH10_ARCLA|nr:hypothetical protein L6452_12983 [Arctium lappa]
MKKLGFTPRNVKSTNQKHTSPILIGFSFQNPSIEITHSSTIIRKLLKIQFLCSNYAPFCIFFVFVFFVFMLVQLLFHHFLHIKQTIFLHPNCCKSVCWCFVTNFLSILFECSSLGWVVSRHFS